jgi:hypothetical protein
MFSTADDSLDIVAGEARACRCAKCVSLRKSPRAHPPDVLFQNRCNSPDRRTIGSTHANDTSGAQLALLTIRIFEF